MRRSGKSTRSSQSTLPSREAPLSPFARRFIKRVQNTANKFALWKPGDAFVVGVSGGPDSLCLLDVLFLLSKKYSFKLHVAHVNYHLRGRASNLDEALTRKAAVRYHLPFSVLSKKKKSKNASEEALRDIRYAFFETVRHKTGASAIAVAHNRDDQAETLLLRLLRGAGLSGLAAMRPKHGSIIRPLIETNRADILRYLHERALAFREDASNTDPRYLRNRIRHELVPLLEKRFQPQTQKLLAETAMLLGDDYALLQDIAPILSVRKNTRGVTFSRSTLLQLPDPALRHAMRTTLQPLLAGKNPGKRLLHEIIKALKSEKGKVRTVTFKGLKLICKGDTVRLLKLTR